MEQPICSIFFCEELKSWLFPGLAQQERANPCQQAEGSQAGASLDDGPGFDAR
jgi:hypothetical protein